jgi:hypothetical protein
VDDSVRNEHLVHSDYKLSQEEQNSIVDVLEEEVDLLHHSEKKSSNIVRGDDEEEDEDEMHDDETLSPETRSAIHERRVCDLAARMTLAILGGALPKQTALTLQRHKGKVGQSYDKIILELTPAPEKPVKKPAPAPARLVEDAMKAVVEDVAPIDDDEIMSAMGE